MDLRMDVDGWDESHGISTKKMLHECRGVANVGAQTSCK